MIKGAGNLKLLEVTCEGTPVTTFKDRMMSFEVEGRNYTMARRGFLGPVYELWQEKQLVMAVRQAPFLNRYSTIYENQAYELKALGITARQMGLFRETVQVGTIAAVHLDACKEILVDLPAELPLEVQAFLLWLTWWKWSDT